MLTNKTREVIIEDVYNAHAKFKTSPSLEEHLKFLAVAIEKHVSSNKQHEYDEYYIKGHVAGQRSWINVIEQDDEPKAYPPDLIANKNFVQGFLDYTEIKRKINSVDIDELGEVKLNRMIERAKLEINPKTKIRV